MQRVSSGYLIVISFLFGCTRPPEIPQFPKQTERPIEQVVLRDTIGAKDVRALFRALNTGNRLAALKPWIEDASDADLNILGRFLTKYLYQDAYSDAGFVGLLHDSVKDQRFSRFQKQVSEHARTKNFDSLMNLLSHLVAQPNLPEILQRDRFLFEENWLNEIKTLPVPTSKPLAPEINKKQILLDTRDFVLDPANRKELLNLTTTLEHTEWVQALFLALKDLNSSQKQIGSETLYSDLAAEISSKLSKDKDNAEISPIEQLLQLTTLLNQPSNGLFSQAQAGLQTETGEAFIQLLGERFAPLLLRTLTGYVQAGMQGNFMETALDKKFWLALGRKSETDAPTAAFGHLYRRISNSLTKLTTSSLTTQSYTLGLSAYVLTAWLEKWAQENAAGIAALPENLSWESFWKLPITGFSFHLSLLELNDQQAPKKDADNKNILSTKVEKELQAIGFEALAGDLKRAVKLDSFGKTTYKFPALPGKNLSQTLADAIQRMQNIQPLVEPVPFFTALLYAFTHPSSTEQFSLASLETPNMLESLHRLLQGLSPDMLKKLMAFLFQDLHLAQLSEEDQESLRGLYPENPETGALLSSLLEKIGVLNEFGQKKTTHQISVLEFYHTWLRHLRPSELGKLGNLHQFLVKAKTFSWKENSPRYPSISQWIENPNGLSRTLQTLSLSTTAQETAIVSAMNAAFFSPAAGTSSGVALHLDLLVELLSANTHDLLLLLDDTQMISLIPQLSSKELAWVHRLVSAGDHKELWTFLLSHSSRANLRSITGELLNLQAQNGLEDVFTLLANIKNERMQRLALGLLEWEKSQELKAFLSLMKSLL